MQAPYAGIMLVRFDWFDLALKDEAPGCAKSKSQYWKQEEGKGRRA
jgi:hypothetical protein